MGYYDIKAGDKIGKVVAARFIESKAGKLGMEIQFRFEEGQSFETLNWVGWLTESAMKYTMDTLVNVLGYNGSKEVDNNGVLTDKNAFEDKEVKLVVEIDPRLNAEGVHQIDRNGEPIYDPRIKWVNSLGGSGFAGVQVQTLKSKLSEIQFDGAFQSLRKASGKPTVAAKKNLPNHAVGAQDKEPSFDSKEELPF